MSYYYRGIPAWAHGYVPDPRRGSGRAEDNLMKIMNEVTYLHPHLDGSEVVALDDPLLFKYPVAYMAEPGFWTMNDKEAAGFRAYLKKGGFLIIDDFRHDGDFRMGGGWANVEDEPSQGPSRARQLLPLESVDESLRLVLQDPVVRRDPAGLRPRPAGVLRPLRRQRSDRSG